MNTSEFFNFLTHMTEDERSLTFKMSFWERAMIGGALMVAGVWGTLMKIFLYYSLWEEKIHKRPINVLILIDQIVDHIAKVVSIVTPVIMVSAWILFTGSVSSKTFLNYFTVLFQLSTYWSTPTIWKYLLGIDWQARNFCVGYSIFSYAMITYASVGSLGIAVYRVLYIKVSVLLPFLH